MKEKKMSISAVKQASALVKLARESGLTDGLDFLRKVDIQDSMAVTYEGLQSRPNHPITAIFQDAIFHFDNLPHMIEVFNHVAKITSYIYKTFLKASNFVNEFEYLIPISHIIDPEDYKEEDEDDLEDTDADNYVYPEDAIALESDADIGEIAEPSYVSSEMKIVVRYNPDEENKDEDEEQVETFILDYDSSIRLFKAFQLIMASRNYETQREGYAEETITHIYDI